MRVIVEACVNSAISAIEAQAGGADRVELCENLHDGGTTPSAGTIKLARAKLRIGLFVMIRPRGGDFLYSEDEFAIMQADIQCARDSGADGVVFGILNSNGTIDMERMAQLVDLARPMGITCHRAFDMAADPFRAMEDLISLGIDRILTSGQMPGAFEGASLIKQLIEKAAGRITIMPGCGIREHNIKELIDITRATEVHVHPEKNVTGRMIFRQESVFMGNPAQSEYQHVLTDAERLRVMINLVNRGNS